MTPEGESQNLGLKHPFGEICFEDEFKILGPAYKTYYFTHVPFTASALNPDVYLIVGRRGVGKSSLAHFFTFQEAIPKAKCIDVDEPVVYQDVLSRIADLAAASDEIAIPQIVKLWEVVIWNLAFEEYREKSAEIESACIVHGKKGSVSGFIHRLIKHVLSLLGQDSNGSLAEEAAKLLESEAAVAAQKATLALLKEEPLIVAIDTLEHYDTENHPMMRATAALIEASKLFNTSYSSRGLHIKTFVTAEVFPHLSEAFVSNFSKYVRDEIYMHWRPKDLMRLLCWRFFCYAQQKGSTVIDTSVQVDWDKHMDVFEKVWRPLFGEWLENGNNVRERTFPYLLRHSQNRPRQLIEICNALAKASHGPDGITRFRPEVIVETVKALETKLATEVINSYSKIYRNVGQIADALMGLPMIFQGKLLDQCAPKAASMWPQGQYSPYKFRQLVSELGIVGRIRTRDEKSKIIAADFEYFIESRLPIMDSDACVIHPMFYVRLNTRTDAGYRIYPFPDKAGYREVFSE